MKDKLKAIEILEDILEYNKVRYLPSTIKEALGELREVIGEYHKDLVYNSVPFIKSQYTLNEYFKTGVLTGSRAYGGADDFSDYDIIVDEDMFNKVSTDISSFHIKQNEKLNFGEDCVGTLQLWTKDGFLVKLIGYKEGKYSVDEYKDKYIALNHIVSSAVENGADIEENYVKIRLLTSIQEILDIK